MNKNIENHQSSIINHKSVSGFTLIELLIVIAIIGVLATLLMVNFVGVRQRARDAQRKSDLRQLQSALEIYRSDNAGYILDNGRTPPYIGECGTPLQATINGKTITYMSKIPCDASSGNYYYSSSDGSAYTLGACLENTGDSQGTRNSPGAGFACASGTYYVVNNP
jgi:general secretion pathway protein G